MFFSASIRPLTPVLVRPFLSTSKSINNLLPSSDTWQVMAPLLPRSKLFLFLSPIHGLPSKKSDDSTVTLSRNCYAGPIHRYKSLITAIHKTESSRCQPWIYSSAKSTLRVRKKVSELSTISVDILVEQRIDSRIRRGLSWSARNSGGDCQAPARSSRR